jgi:PAS domain S-box-containing protein
MIACIPMAVYSVDLDGRVTTWNRSAEEMFGWTAAEVLGRPLPIVDDEARPGFLEILDRVGSGDRIAALDVVRRHQDGHAIECRLSAAPIIGEEGRPMGVMAILEDVSEQRGAERQLLESEARFRSLFENNHVAMLVIDPSEGSIVDANPAAVEYYGWSCEELLGMSISDINTLGPDEVRTEMQRAAAQQRHHFQFRHRLANGTIRDVEVTSGPIEIGGRPLLYSLVFDVTERIRLEEELRHAQKMESIGRLAGGIAHDFNNMLAVILLETELALLEVDADHDLRSRLDEIHATAQRSAQLTRQLLAFARKQAASVRRLDLDEVVGGAVSMLRRLIGDDVLLVWEPHGSAWPVRADPTHLEQALANLCLNARDAIHGRGTIVIASDNVTVVDAAGLPAGARPGDYVRLSVTDDGDGMDRATAALVFEPFFTTKETGSGTGLGLAIVYGTVAQYGGFVRVTSAPGEGAAFEVYLPRDREAGGPAPRRPTEHLPRGRGETVLVVEDEPALRRVTTEMLTSLGYRVLSAPEATAALEVVAAHGTELGLLLTDVIMPGPTGVELAASVRARHPELPVVFMSGHASGAIEEQAGFDDSTFDRARLLHKPFTLAELAGAVREGIEGVVGSGGSVPTAD